MIERRQVCILKGAAFGNALRFTARKKLLDVWATRNQRRPLPDKRRNMQFIERASTV